MTKTTNSRPVRVLLAHDKQDERNLVREALEEAEHCRFLIDRLASYDEALAAMKTNEHDVYLLDHHLGSRAGLDLIREAKSLGCEGPILLMTERGDLELALQAMDAGATDFLVKEALNSGELERTIRYALSRNQSEKHLQHHARRQSAIADLGRLALRTRQLDPLIGESARTVAEMFQSDRVRILELSADGGKFLLKSTYSISGAPDSMSVIPVVHDSLPGSALISNDPMVVEDFRMERRFSASPVPSDPELISGIVCRIGAPTQPWGVIGVFFGKRRRFNRSDIDFVQTISHLVGEAASRVRVERELRNSTALYHSLVENLPQCIIRKDAQGRFTFVNQNFCDSLRKGEHEILGKTDFDFYPAELAAKYRDDDKRIIESGKPFHAGEGHIAADGRKRHIEVIKTPLRDADGKTTGVQCIFWDATERKELETRLLRSQRLESIGTLAGGIAHDLNNILGPIMMAAEILGMKTKDPGIHKSVNLIASNAHRGAEIVKQILTFARGASGERIPVQLKHLIKDIIKITRETFPKSIDVTSEIPPGLWLIVGDPTQLHQILLNLSVNARDAMEDGGRLSITASNISLDEAYASMNRDAKVGPYVVLQVTDSGGGIPPAMLDKVFDPFFTTKPQGKGTGLGLSTVLGIVKSHGGFIQAYSERGGGTTFKIYLPACPEATEADPVKSEPILCGGNGETILVVDDEPDIRNMAQTILVRHGYKVLLAAEGTEGIVAFVQNRDAIKAVVTDILMPNMDGVALIRSIRKIDSQVKIVASSGMASGFGRKSKVTELRSLGIEKFLNKPYTSRRLLDALRGVLEQPVSSNTPEGAE